MVAGAGIGRDILRQESKEMMTLIKQWETLSGTRVVFTRDPCASNKNAEYFTLTLAPIRVMAYMTDKDLVAIESRLTEDLAIELRKLADELDAG